MKQSIKRRKETNKQKGSKSKASIKKPRVEKVKPAPKTTLIEKLKIALDVAKLLKEVGPMLQDINWSDLLDFVISSF